MCRYLHFKECIYKFSRLCKANREFLQDKLDQIKEERLFTFSMDARLRLERRVPRRRMWLTRCFNWMQVEISN